MNLINKLLQPVARNFLYLPNKIPLNTGISLIANSLQSQSPTVNISVITHSSFPTQGRVIGYSLDQLSEPLLKILLSDANQVLIIQLSTQLLEFKISENIGRILLVGDPFIGYDEMMTGIAFLRNVPLSNVQLINLFQEYGTLGYKLVKSQYGKFNIEQFDPVKLALTPNQELEYQKRYAQDRLHPHQELYFSLQATNFLYPPNIQQLHDISRVSKVTIPPDNLVTEGGWIQPKDFEYLTAYSPKLNWCIKFLKLKGNEGKHVILTSFNSSFGIKVLTTFLRLAGISVVRITGDDRPQARYQKAKFFNTATNAVCLTNLPAFIPLTNVRSIIVFENHQSDRIINSYLRALAFSTNVLHLIFLVAVGSDGTTVTVDGEYLDLTLRKLRTRNRILYQLNEKSIYPDLDFYQQALNLMGATLGQLNYYLKEYYFKEIN